MATPTTNVLLTLNVATQDINPPSNNILNRPDVLVLYPAVTVIYQGYLPASNVPTANMITNGQTASVVYIRHAGSSDDIFISLQFNGSAIQSFDLSPGGVFLYAIPTILNPASEGIIFLTVQGLAANTSVQPVEILIAI